MNVIFFCFDIVTWNYETSKSFKSLWITFCIKVVKVLTAKRSHDPNDFFVIYFSSDVQFLPLYIDVTLYLLEVDAGFRLFEFFIYLDWT